MQVVSIPAGSFMMGCSAGDHECYAEEKPIHRVSITRPFEMGKYQVTQAEYEAVMATNPSYSQGPTLPVDGVSWEDAQKFCEAVNRKGDGYHYRLPTEAEWEYAARGGDSSCRYGSLDVVAWFRDNSGGTTHPVGEKKPNRFGLHDTFGKRLGMGAGLVRHNLLRPQSRIRPEGPSQRGVSRFARRFLSRTCQRTGARFLPLYPKAQRPKYRDWVPLCA